MTRLLRGRHGKYVVVLRDFHVYKIYLKVKKNTLFDCDSDGKHQKCYINKYKMLLKHKNFSVSPFDFYHLYNDMHNS